jgi:DNA polymerase III delta subunit
MQIENLKKLKPCYFFMSSSSSILDEEIEKIKKSLKNMVDISIDFKIFDLNEEGDMADFVNFYKTPSFFSEKKAAVIKNFENASSITIKLITDLLEDISKASGEDVGSKPLHGAGGNVPEFGTILFITSAKDIKNKDLNGLLLKLGSKKKLVSPVSESLKKWLVEKSELDGISFTGRAAARLLENVNYDFAVLKKEYEKLSIYISSEKEKTVNETAVNRLVNRIFDMKIFDLVDYIGRKDKNNALVALKSVLLETAAAKKKVKKSSAQLSSDSADEDKKSITGLITLLHRMYKAVFYYKETASREILSGYVNRHVGHYPFIANKLVKNYEKFSEYYSREGLVRIFNILAEYDFLLRTVQSIKEQKNLILRMIAEITAAS